jgi:hypothetical protein
VNWDVDISESENIPEQGVGPSNQTTPEDNLVDSRTDGSGSDSDSEDEDYVLSDTDDGDGEDSGDDERWLDADEMYGQDDSDEDLYE